MNEFEIQNSRRSFVVLNFPGVVENVDIAVESLGGLNKLTSDHFHFNALELAYHRQQNPYSRSTPSRKASNNFMMLHVRRPRKHNQEALVTVYDFSSVFDFQYLPMSGNATTGFSSVLDDLVPKDIESAMRWFDPPAESHHPDLFLTPYAFTRSFTSNPYPSVMCKEPERSPAVRALVDNAQFPTHPTPEFIHDADTKYPSPEAQRALEEVSLAWLTILPKFAFYITTGPWGRLWCRYGYDPKTNRDAAKYEVVNMQMGNLRTYL
ncbi:unnamed protein product [Soboliphyme baturini]|uniref:Tau95 domain-containing protein n=1 Tax=Soboliphyme baturini TaxID=241478 RepID=A0A183IR65_9BILA|nr:unnamed protein product [Soboliphyme baturini]